MENENLSEELKRIANEKAIQQNKEAAEEKDRWQRLKEDKKTVYWNFINEKMDCALAEYIEYFLWRIKCAANDGKNGYFIELSDSYYYRIGNSVDLLNKQFEKEILETPKRWPKWSKRYKKEDDILWNKNGHIKFIISTYKEACEIEVNLLAEKLIERLTKDGLRATKDTETHTYERSMFDAHWDEYYNPFGVTVHW